MINGAHVLIYSTDPDADRRFFREVLGFPFVDVGGGWLIFALPPAEVAVHPSEGAFVQRHGDHQMLGAIMYLMCDDVRAMVNSLGAQKVTCTALEEEQWGITTAVPLPSGGYVGLYQPKHPTALGLGMTGDRPREQLR
jgi:catechol 2,3-dioxygenase-like lactoylglutathione lyase family enzyme